MGAWKAVKEAANGPVGVTFAAMWIAFEALGGRLSYGIFQVPIQKDMGWPRSVFSLALALSSLLGGLFGPFWAIAAESSGRPAATLMVAAALFIGGNFLFAAAGSMPQAAWVAGNAILFGLGTAGLSVSILLGAVGRLFPAQDPAGIKRRSLVFGAVPAFGQVGQFALAPLGRYLIAQYGWVRSAQILAFQSLIVVPMVLLLRKQTPKRPVPDETVADSKDTKPVQGNPLSATSAPAAATPAPRFESIPEPSTALLATKEAFTHLPVLLITTAYVSCGWTLGFISASLAASLQDRGFSADIAAWALSSIGIGSLFGTMLSGILPAAVSWITPKRLLSMVYTVRGILLFALAALPVSNPGLITVCVCLGLVWFSSIPPTTSLFAFICGTRWLGTISSVAFAVHQVGMFLGAYLGAVEYDQRGNYNICFWFTAGLSVVAGGVVAIVPGGSLRRREIVGGGDYVVLGSQEVVATEDVDKA